MTVHRRCWSSSYQTKSFLSSVPKILENVVKEKIIFVISDNNILSLQKSTCEGSIIHIPTYITYIHVCRYSYLSKFDILLKQSLIPREETNQLDFVVRSFRLYTSHLFLYFLNCKHATIKQNN